MRVIQINNKEVFIRYNISNIKQLSKIGVTLNTVSISMQNMDITPLSMMFYYGVKSLKPEITEDEADNLMDDYLLENDISDLADCLMTEFSKALGIKPDPKQVEEAKKQALEKINNNSQI